MSNEEICCPCDVTVRYKYPEIPAGNIQIPRQIDGFSEYRLALLHDIRSKDVLRKWVARKSNDLGVMLLETYALCLDVLGFYNERIANKCYLRTVRDAFSVNELIALVGYRPQEAIAAKAVLAAISESPFSLSLTSGTRFSSSSFLGSSSQIFEPDIDATPECIAIIKNRNQFTLDVNSARDNSTKYIDMLMKPTTAAITRDQLAVFMKRWETTRDTTPSFNLRYSPNVEESLYNGHIYSIIPTNKNDRVDCVARKVKSTDIVVKKDGNKYVQLNLGIDSKISSNSIDNVSVSSPSLKASLTSLNAYEFGEDGSMNFVRNISSISTEQGKATRLYLDSVYNSILANDFIVIENNGEYRVGMVIDTNESQAKIQGFEGSVPITYIDVIPEWKALSDGSDAFASLTIHFNMIDAGELTAPAKIELTIEDFADPIPIEGLSEPIPKEHQPTRLMLEDANGQGVLINGTVNIHDDGSGEVVITDDKEFPKPLRTPIKVYGNLIEATRGETVRDEVLGSGDAQQAFQSFTLARKPLTYLHDPTGPNQRRSTLEVRVNGIKWREEPSFFGTTPTDEIYIVRQNSEGESVITFGDGTYGARLPSGVDNVVATYRFGAGAAVPPAGSITQLVRPVEGLRRIRNPVQADGGADGDRPEDIRRNAPTAALTLGRAVSTQDFEALARQYGVLNAQVEWGWDKPSQRAAVMVWYIPSGGTSKPGELKRSLRGQTDPNVPIQVNEAKRVYFDLTLEVEHDDRTPPDQVAAGVHEALFHPDTGLLAPRNVSIGRPIFRSRVVEAASAVEGVVAVKRIAGMPLSNSELRERDLPEADEDAAEWYVESQAFRIATGTYPYFLEADINISATRGQP